ncbi:hypothetical protein [Mycolicibacterium palauense]|uniref:hypothetical protein n=1 Tax=Mycolicibacterium palauense TaxID=2034511 RepID=UPI00159B86DE|nr:hypothetical protein [Mycolicibacterium palauense]
MLDSARNFVASHHDVTRVVREARRFSVNLPLVGKVSVPPPNHLAFYGALAVLGVTELIPWPVAVGLGVGHALASRNETGPAPASETAPPEENVPAAKAPGGNAPAAKKAPAKKAPAKRAPAKKAAAKKTAATQPPRKP